MIRVLIADESPQVTDNISRRLALEDDFEVCGTVADGEAAVQQAVWLKPDIAVVDAGLPGIDGSQTTQMLVQSLPDTGVIMMSMEAEDDAYRLAMVAGAREFLQKPFKGDDLVAAVRRVHAFQQKRAAASTPAAQERTKDAQRNAETLAPRVSTRGRVIAVISGKGGVGKTVIAINLAAALARTHAGRVALVDLSLQFGDIGAALNLPTDHTITELLPENGTADSDTVSQALVAGPGTVRVLLAPTSPELADYVSAAHLTSLLETLRKDYDFIVIDTPSYLTDVSIRMVELADQVVMVSDLSVTGVKNARLTRGILETLGTDPTTVVVVANHRDSAGELDTRGAETFLGARISIEIPFAADLVAGSIKKGIPFILSSPSAPPSVALAAIANLLDPVSQTGGDSAANDQTPDQKRRGRRRLKFSR
jgi:pilus assembly protein CpaE